MIEDALVVLRKGVRGGRNVHFGCSYAKGRVLGIGRDGHSGGDDAPGNYK
jgi:hypothetical protein